MTWKMPPKIKIYEALGCIADGRITVTGNTATVRSSNGRKTYTVAYDPEQNAIMANDNGSYWQGYLGYPAIAFLLKQGVIPYRPQIAVVLAGIPWKEINTRFKNDHTRTEAYVLERAGQLGISPIAIREEIDRILAALAKLELQILGRKVRPPAESGL
ncbi:MAG: hypothetical protein HY978_00305 [Candidatus Liptonbacteria bacterium]|nr:hypothetical protein [Candidatus Liptonbacteria bacterium]